MYEDNYLPAGVTPRKRIRLKSLVLIRTIDVPHRVLLHKPIEFGAEVPGPVVNEAGGGVVEEPLVAEVHNPVGLGHAADRYPGALAARGVQPRVVRAPGGEHGRVAVRVVVVPLSRPAAP